MTDIIKELIKDYLENSEVCMAEYLASKEVPQGITFEDATAIYISCMKQINRDKFFVEKEGEMIEL
jgi:hypothetical protein